MEPQCSFIESIDSVDDRSSALVQELQITSYQPHSLNLTPLSFSHTIPTPEMQTSDYDLLRPDSTPLESWLTRLEPPNTPPSRDYEDMPVQDVEQSEDQ